MTRFVLAVLVAAVPVFAADPPKPEEAKKEAKKAAQTMSDAFLKGDFEVVFDHTYEGVYKELVGRKEAEKAGREQMKQMEAEGFRMKAYTVSDPGDLHTEGDNTFVVLPTTLEMTAPKGTVVVKSYALGISPDGGKTWKFVAGTGLKDKQVREKVLPKLPAKLELPEIKPPEITKEKEK